MGACHIFIQAKHHSEVSQALIANVDDTTAYENLEKRGNGSNNIFGLCSEHLSKILVAKNNVLLTVLPFLLPRLLLHRWVQGLLPDGGKGYGRCCKRK